MSYSSQAQSLSKGDNLINISIGLGDRVRPQGFKTVLSPLVFQFEHALADQITVGAYLGFGRSFYENEGNFAIPQYPYNTEFQKYRWNATNVLVGIKGAYHFGELLNTTKKLDPYVGLTLGYNFIAVKIKQIEGNVNLNPYLEPDPKTKAMAGIFVGARYYLNEQLALFGELGLSTAVLQVGLSFKLP